MSQTIVGIDLGSYSVKVSVLERSLRDFELVSFYEQPIPQATRLTREEAIASTVKNLLEKNKVPLESVAVNFPAHHLACRVLELPFTNIKKIEQTIDFELENFIPVPLEDLIIDYHILSIEENRSTVLCAYVPRVRFLKYYEALQAGGVDPRFIGVDAIDLSHISEIAMVPQEGVFALIDIGHEKTNICVMNGKTGDSPKLEYVRSITIGGLHFTRCLQKVFKLNYEKAEGLKQERGRVSISDDGLDQVSRNLNQVARELLAFIRQTYLGYRHLYSDKEWNSIFLCGGGSKLQGLSDMISSSMRLNVGALECIDLINHRLTNIDDCRETIPVSLSQTLKIIFSNKAIKINLRRGEFAYKRDIKALGGEIKQLGLWLVIVFMLGLAHFLFSTHVLQTRIEKIDSLIGEEVVKALPELKSSSKSSSESSSKELLSSINDKMGEIETELGALNPKVQIKVMPLLLEISQKMPVKEEMPIDIDDLSFTGDNIRLEGRTNSFEAVDKIKNTLSTSPHFKNVTTQNVSKGVRSEIKFTLTFDIGLGESPLEEEPMEVEKEKKKEDEEEKEKKKEG